jgi:glyoxylase-like metal-dependent hydrolase (beta-lactamase superfamily II)
VDEIVDGIRRVTLPLPTRPGHVHAYLLPGGDGFTLVDTGLGLPDASERWQQVLAELGAPVVAILVTHFHPDHVGAARDVAELTGVTVRQGRLDHAQCVRAWGSAGWPHVIASWFNRHGVPETVTRELVEQGSLYAPFIRFAADTLPVEPGDRIDGWEVVAAPGHADGQLCLLQDGILVAADHVLDPISPTVGLWPESRPDPLGDYLAALERTIELAPRLALPGHGDPIADPVGRARALVAHHRERLDAAEAGLSLRPRTAYDLSYPLFGPELKPGARRFAVAETLSHLERLVREGRAARREDDGIVAYTSS